MHSQLYVNAILSLMMFFRNFIDSIDVLKIIHLKKLVIFLRDRSILYK